MSWFNAGIANLAKNALSQAQKTIDRALDIKDTDDSHTQSNDDTDNFFAAFGLENAENKTVTTNPTREKKSLEPMAGSLWGSFSGSFFETAQKNNDNYSKDKQEFKESQEISATNFKTVKKVVVSDDTTSSNENLNLSKKELSKATSSSNFVIVNQPTQEKTDLESLETFTEPIPQQQDSNESDQSLIAENSIPEDNELAVSLPVTEVALKESEKSCENYDNPLEKNSFENLAKSTDSTETIKQEIIETVETAEPEIINSNDSWENNFSVRNSEQDKSSSNMEKSVITSEPKGTTSTDSKSFIPIEQLLKMENNETNNYENKCTKISISRTEERETEINDVETKSTDSLISYNSSTGSFVKCMIDEAMRENDARRSHSPHSTTSSEKSDMVKLESEQNSGHTSGDEVETTTSSDVEIISISSPNGDNVEKINLSPMKQVWVGKGPFFRRGDRAESPASDSSSVRESSSTVHLRSERNSGSRSVNNRKMNKPFEGITEVEGSHGEMEKLLKKMTELTEVLHARENKLLELSRENVSLQEANSSLKNQLHQSEEAHAVDTKDVTTLTEEFSQRLATMERNLQQALTEKETLKVELQRSKEEMAQRLCAKHVEEMIKEKDSQIEQLMQEGEKLSKQHLQQSNIIKKLRAKEKETDSLIKQQKEKLEEQSAELERVRKSLTAKEEIERKQIDAIRQLTNTVQKHEKEISALKIELTEGQVKLKSAHLTLENTTKELSELRRANMEKESLVQEATLSAEMAAKDELRSSLERVQKDARLTQEGLILQIEDLRLSLGRSEQQASRREDVLRQEIADAQQKLQEAEVRNQELTQNVSSATRPLLRQIENLQATFSSQTASWEKLETNLTERLNKAQNQLSVAVEKERNASEKYREMSSRVSSLETQIDLLRQEKTRLEVKTETEQTKLRVLEEWKTKELLQMESLKHSYADEMNNIKKEKKALEHQLEIEKTVVEAEKRKCAALQEQLKEKERKLSQVFETSNRTTPSPTPSLSRFSSVSESFNPWPQEDLLDHSLIMSTSSSGNKFNLYESLRHNGATSLLENLQSQLKMREGEIIQLQNEIAQLERVRDSMALEMVELSRSNEELDESLKQLREQQNGFEDMQKKYDALLQMYGEKLEEANELRLDLIDVKEMYKAQISELLKKS